MVRCPDGIPPEDVPAAVDKLIGRSPGLDAGPDTVEERTP